MNYSSSNLDIICSFLSIFQLVLLHLDRQPLFHHPKVTLFHIYQDMLEGLECILMEVHISSSLKRLHTPTPKESKVTKHLILSVHR